MSKQTPAHNEPGPIPGFDLQDIFDNSPIGIFTTTPSGRITSANLFLARMFGYDSPKELIESTTDIATQFYADPDDRKEFIRLLKEHGEVTNHECRFRRRDRTVFWGARSARAVKDQKGRIVAYQGFHTDVTDRKRSEEALEKRLVALTQPLDSIKGVAFEEMFSITEVQRLQDEFAQATKLAALITRPDGTPITVPSNFCRLCTIIRKTEIGRANCIKSDSVLGCLNPSGPAVQSCLSAGLWDAGAAIFVGDRHIANWLVGQVRDEEQSEEQDEEKIRAYARAIGTDEDAAAEAFREVPAMSRQQFEQVAKALFTLATQLSNSAYQNVQQARFISERKRAEEALRRSEKLFRKVLEILPIGFWIADKNGKLMQGNPAGVAIWGAEPNVDQQEYGVFKARRLPSGEEIAPDDWALAHTVNKGETIVDELLEIDAFDGNQKIILNYTAPVLDERGNVEAAIVVNQDITARYQAEEELRFKNALLEGIIESYLSPIFSLDREYRYTSFNQSHAQRMKALYGVDIQIGRSLYEYQTVAEDREKSRRNIDRALRGESFRDESFSGNHELSRVFIEVTHNPIRDERGQVIGVSIFSRDITERKQAEDRLRESEERFKALHNASFGGIAIHDKGVILECNQGLSEITGLSYDELIGMDGLLLIAEKSRELVMSNILSGYEKPYEAFGVRKNGKEYPARLEARNIPYKQKMVRVVEFRDITEQKLAEEALRESEGRFRSLFEHVPTVAVQGYGMDGVTLFWNKASEKFYGYSPDEAMGKKLVDLIITDEMRPEVVQQMKSMSETGIPIPTAELHLKRKDGSLIQVYSSHTIVQRPDQPPELFCIDVDLTELKMAQVALVDAKEQAEAANQAKSEFLANMSHELRTPLNGVMGIMQLLQTTELDKEQQRWISMAIKSSDRLARLLTDILDISRVEAGKMELVDEEFRLKELYDSIYELFIPMIQDKDVVMECAIDAAMPTKLIGDAARVRQVLFNLVGNAYKFTEQGKVSVEMVPLSSYRQGFARVLFSVSDTGIGIPEDKLDGLCKPFVQVVGSYTRSYQGAGLGLSIVRRLVDLMGGSINIDSTLGAGTTVYFVLPFKLPEAVSIPGQCGLKKVAEASQKLRILLAEDEPSNALPIRKLLEKAGHTVTLAEDGQQALDLLKTHDFDVILMDIQMPVMDGVEATKMIRRLEDNTNAGMQESWHSGIEKTERTAEIPAPAGQSEGNTVSTAQASQYPRIPIIALTAYAMVGDREKFIEAGMDDYLAKPVNIEDLEQVLRKNTHS